MTRYGWLAVLCFFLASFFAWRGEHGARLAAEERLAARIYPPTADTRECVNACREFIDRYHGIICAEASR